VFIFRFFVFAYRTCIVSYHRWQASMGMSLLWHPAMNVTLLNVILYFELLWQNKISSSSKISSSITRTYRNSGQERSNLFTVDFIEDFGYGT